MTRSITFLLRYWSLPNRLNANIHFRCHQLLDRLQSGPVSKPPCDYSSFFACENLLRWAVPSFKDTKYMKFLCVKSLNRATTLTKNAKRFCGPKYILTVQIAKPLCGGRTTARTYFLLILPCLSNGMEKLYFLKKMCGWFLTLINVYLLKEILVSVISVNAEEI